jgi:hypothetical protein
MKAEYEINIKDITAFYYYFLYKRPVTGIWPKIKRNWGIVLVPLFIMLGFIFALVFHEYGMAVVGIVFASVIVLYYYVIRSQMVRNMVISSYRDNPNRLLGKHELSISSESIVDRNGMGESVTPWKNVNFFAADKQYLYIGLPDAEP